MADSGDVSRQRSADRSASTVAFKVALTYAVATAIWIVGSGYLVLLLPHGSAERAEIYKGLAFTIVTTVLLYFAISGWARRYASQAQSTHESHVRTEQILRAIPAGVLLVGTSGAIEYANPEAERVMGISGVEMVGLPLELVARATDDSRADISRLLRDGRVEGLSISAKSGENERVIIASAARLGTVDSSAGWVLALSDVTGNYMENERVRRLVRGYRLISLAMHAIQTASDTRQLLQAVTETVAADGALAGAWAAAPDQTSGTSLETVAQYGLPPGVLSRIEEVSIREPSHDLGGVVEELGQGHLYVVNDIAADPISPFMGLEPAVPFGSSVTFEVTAPTLPLAVLSFFSAEVGFFDQEQIRLVEILRDVIVFAVSKFELDAKWFNAEDSLERSESAYRQMFEKNPEPMWVYDVATLGFLAVNEAVVKKYGYSAQEFERMTLIDIRPPEDIPRLLHSVAHHASSGNNEGYWTHIDKSGHVFAVRVMTNAISWSGLQARLALIQEVATVD